MNKKALKNRFGTIISTILLAIILLSNINILIVNVAGMSTVSNSNLIIADSQSLLSTDWEQINEDGFGSKHNRGPRGIEVFNGNLVVGTANYNEENAVVLGRSFLMRKAFYELFINVSYQNDYFKSDGCEVWSYNESFEQRCLIGPTGYLDSGFGSKNNLEIGAIIEFNRYLYVGTRNHVQGCEIWRTDDLENWEKVADRGFGNRYNGAAWIAAVFKDQLYVGTMNFVDGIEVFRTSNGEDWEPVVGRTLEMTSGFGEGGSNFYAWSMAVYDDYLYVGTCNLNGGGELWKSDDGVNWKPVFAGSNFIQAFLKGADYPRGMERGIINFRGGIRNMIVYNDELYVGFTSENLLYTFSTPRFEKLIKFHQMMPLLIRPFKHFMTQGIEIWKYNSTEDKWSRVVGGRGNGNFSGSFNDPKNEYPWSMTVYNGSLYVGTANIDSVDFIFERQGLLRWNFTSDIIKGKTQIWRYDGDCLEQLNPSGFGDEYNIGTRAMKVFNNNLVACTFNMDTGVEVWKKDLS